MYRDIYIHTSNNYCIVLCEFNAADTGRKEEKPGYDVQKINYTRIRAWHLFDTENGKIFHSG
jgi:ribosomal protein S18